MSFSILINYDPEITVEHESEAVAHAKEHLADVEGLATIVVVDPSGEVSAFFTNRRITTTFSLISPAGHTPHIGTVAAELADLTEAILTLPTCSDMIQALLDAQEVAQLAKQATGLETLTFDHAALIESTCEFFGINDIEDLTDDRYNAAAAAVVGGLIEETITLEVKVSIRRGANQDIGDFIENLHYEIRSQTPGVHIIDTELS